MSSDWKTYTLGELGHIRTGKTPPSSLGDGFGGAVPFVTPGDMNGQKWIFDTSRYLNERGLSAISSSLMPARSVAVSCIGSDMGKAALLARPSVTNQQINTIAVDESRFNAEFVYYDLSVRQRQLKAAASGSATPILNKGHFSSFEISLPPRATQDRIAEIMGALDDNIDLNLRINQTLEAIAQAIFKSWFVDFDPVKAKIAAIEQGEDPIRAAMRAISGKTGAALDQMPREHYDQLAATAALFPNEMNESELGETPKGWEASTIGEMVEIAGGATPDTKNESYWNPPEHFWTSPKDLSGAQSPVLLATERRISTAGLSRIGSGLLPKGTLLMSSRAPIGYLAITQIPVAINQGYIAMLPGAKLPPFYLLMWCQQNMEEIKGQANGSTFMEISKKAFRPLPVIYPGSDLMGRFVEAMIPLFEQLVARVKESSLLADLRDALLPRLLSGELTVSSDLNDEESQ